MLIALIKLTMLEEGMKGMMGGGHLGIIPAPLSVLQGLKIQWNEKEGWKIPLKPAFKMPSLQPCGKEI